MDIAPALAAQDRARTNRAVGRLLHRLPERGGTADTDGDLYKRQFEPEIPRSSQCRRSRVAKTRRAFGSTHPVSRGRGLNLGLE